MRADEACHSHVNHTFATMQKLDKNPFQVRQSKQGAAGHAKCEPHAILAAQLPWLQIFGQKFAMGYQL